MFFSSWEALIRVIVVGSLAYLALVIMVRLYGKRTLAKMNAFDLVVTVAIGSTLATALLSRDVALAEAVVAFALLFTLQFAITWMSVRSDSVRKMVKAEPSMLFYRGEFLRDAMAQQRVTDSEVLQAMRAQGNASLAEIEAVVLETDGTFSVIKSAPRVDRSALRNVASSTDQSA